MLIEFSVENFLSFKERNTFTMLASKDNNLKDNYVLVNNDRILLSTALFGANASGKSNLFKILNTVSEMIKNSNFNSPTVALPIIPFKLDDESSKKPSFFEIKFVINNIRYLYGFKADAHNVYEEHLTYYPKGRPVKIFKRENINDYVFNSNEKILTDIKSKNTANKFFVATATNWNYEKTKPVYEFLTENIKFSKCEIDYSLYNDGIKDFALKFLKKADFNIDNYYVLGKNLRIKTKHIINGNEYEFDLQDESLGTQVIFSYIPIIKEVLDNGKILVIDEIDRSLHPFIVKYIVEIFSDENYNKNHAQLIFNTHDTNLLDLDLLRRDQVWFAEKDVESGSSTIFPLDDFSVRASENIEKGYLLGRYGAVPFIN